MSPHATAPRRVHLVVLALAAALPAAPTPAVSYAEVRDRDPVFLEPVNRWQSGPGGVARVHLNPSVGRFD